MTQFAVPLPIVPSNLEAIARTKMLVVLIDALARCHRHDYSSRRLSAVLGRAFDMVLRIVTKSPSPKLVGLV